MADNIAETTTTHQNIAKKTHEGLMALSTVDSLTQLDNRRMFLRELDKAQEMLKRGEMDYVVMYMDLDKFKPINDNDPTHHVMGDKVLVEVASTLRDMFRHTDVKARLGGDEFGIILPGYDPDADEKGLLTNFRGTFEEKFKDKAKHLIAENPSVGDLSVSFGIVEPTWEDTVETVMQKADTLMYKNKVAKKSNE